MGRAPCCDKANVKKGPWCPEEDAKLKEYIEKHGTGGNWIALPQKAGLKRCGKSCRLRWLNYLRPNIKHGEFSEDEDRIICNLFASIGSRWSIIAAQLPGRTDNDIKNYWNTKLKKKMMGMNSSTQGKPHHAIQNSASSYSSSSSRDSTNPYYYHPHVSVQGSSSSSLLSGNSCISAANSIFGNSNFMGPIQNQLVLEVAGGEAASCSSSDGSSNNNQISHVKEAELVYGGGGALVQQIGGCRWTEKQSGLWGDNPLDYGLEEIKQLIISTNSCSNFLFDESKTEESVVYF